MDTLICRGSVGNSCEMLLLEKLHFLVALLLNKYDLMMLLLNLPIKYILFFLIAENILLYFLPHSLEILRFQ